MRAKGNALFLILIAVALFAALSYAVTQSGRGGAGIDAEQAQIEASQILQYATALKTATDRLKIINGCSKQEFSFENATVPGYTNAGAPTDKSCHIFDQNGGGLSLADISEKALDSAYSAHSLYGYPFFSSRNHVASVPALTALGQSKHDLVVYFQFIKKEVCQALNNLLFDTPRTDDPPHDRHQYHLVKFTGDYDTVTGGVVGQINTGDFDYTGEYSACFSSVDGTVPSSYTPPTPHSNEYVFYHVLIAN